MRTEQKLANFLAFQALVTIGIILLSGCKGQVGATGQGAPGAGGAGSPTCGDGKQDDGEACDTGIAAGAPGACPTACDDGKVETKDALLDADTCSARCEFVANTPTDGYCPSGFTIAQDPECARRFSYEAEVPLDKGGLHHQVGKAEGDGWAVNPSTDAAGGLAFGPYAKNWGVGVYRALFRVLIDNNTADDAEVLALDIHDMDSRVIVARKSVTRKKFTKVNAYQDIVVPFVLMEPHKKHAMEARVFWRKNAYVKLDKITIEEVLPKSVTVCPTGIAGQNGCDFIGGDGLHQAISQAGLPDNPEDNILRIILKAGRYSRQQFVEYVFTVGAPFRRKVMTLIKDKNVFLDAENAAVLDGAASAPMGGLAAASGAIWTRAITVEKFKREPDCDVENVSTPCGQGDGITVLGNAVAVFSNITLRDTDSDGFRVTDNAVGGLLASHVSDNKRFGAGLWDYGYLVIQNNIIRNSGDSGVYGVDSGNLRLINNVLDSNRGAGLEIYECQASSPTVTAINNHTSFSSVTGTNWAYGIGVDCKKSANLKNKNSVVSNNFAYGNAKEHADCNGEELCEPYMSFADPGYSDRPKADYHLKAGSASINAGDASIQDPDGSVSDIGAYGGVSACALDSTLPGCSQP